ncbi:MAG: HD domain-containing protein [Candidatus Bathyarchaeota archaeon]|nr:MAG: HD domain-containing protein [Candidatus Bathyarchaeota archaeon]
MEKHTQQILERIRERSREFYTLAHHAQAHTERVYTLAWRIAREENADQEVVLAAALLHDLARAMEDQGKISDHAVVGADMARRILEEVVFPAHKIEDVIHCIKVHRFRARLPARTLEAEILQDADRLDILGAIGIARVFSRGGWSNKPIYNPEIAPKQVYDGDSLTSVNHILEKLVKVKDTINTRTGKRIAENRHQFIEAFLERFLKEWNGEL